MRVYIQKNFRGGVKKGGGRPFKMWLVGLVETETFFSEASEYLHAVICASAKGLCDCNCGGCRHAYSFTTVSIMSDSSVFTD